ncbi:MAG: GNAT family N-acetyltransferase [Actinomycetota bacterium]
MSDEHLLDNMAWHALTGPQADLADHHPDAHHPDDHHPKDHRPTEPSDDGDGDAPEPAALRFRRAVAPFSATEHLDDDGWAALGRLVGPGGAAILFRAEIDTPPNGWQPAYQGRTIQYVATGLAEVDRTVADDIVELGPDDSDDMVALVALTEPGPFSAETWRTGRYFGLRRDGQLLAMAGERLKVDGWGEVSAVCVHPSARGQGLGAALTLAAAAAIAERGDRPMLHVAEANDPAHQLYLRLGFEVRRTVAAGAYRFVGPG